MANVLKEKKREQPEPEVINEVIAEKPEKKKIKQRQKKEEAPAKANGFISTLKDERTHKIFGLFLILVSVFLLIAFSSFFFTWKNDQNLVSGSWIDLFRYSDYKVENWLGKMGADRKSVV